MHYDAKRLVVEIYLALERASARPSIDRVRAVARAAGAKFTNSESVAWLNPFRQSAENRRNERQVIGGKIEHESAENRRNERRENGLTRDKVIPSSPISRASLRSARPASAPQASSGQETAPQGRPPRALRLPLDAELHDAARAILAAIWAELGATAYSATITKTEWGRRNARVAADLARSGVTPERCVLAWQAATERLSSPVRTLTIVQDELGRMALTLPKLRAIAEEPAWLIQARQRGVEDARLRSEARAAARGVA